MKDAYLRATYGPPSPRPHGSARWTSGTPGRLKTLSDTAYSETEALLIALRYRGNSPLVETSHKIDLKDLRGLPFAEPNDETLPSRRLGWSLFRTSVVSVARQWVSVHEAQLIVQHRVRDGRTVSDREIFDLDSTETRFGGLRWWVSCAGLPGRPCCRRVRVLIRPPGEPSFACVRCHGAVYASSRLWRSRLWKWQLAPLRREQRLHRDLMSRSPRRQVRALMTLDPKFVLQCLAETEQGDESAASQRL